MTDLHNRYHALPVSELTGQALDDDERLGAGKQVQYPVSPEEMHASIAELRELRAERDAALARVAELEKHTTDPGECECCKFGHSISSHLPVIWCRLCNHPYRYADGTAMVSGSRTWSIQALEAQVKELTARLAAVHERAELGAELVNAWTLESADPKRVQVLRDVKFALRQNWPELTTILDDIALEAARALLAKEQAAK